jgi:hypothetical protein
MHSETRQCNRCKGEFTLDESDFSFYDKMKVPAPHVCPECRFKMRALWRNEMSLYSGLTCNLCKKNVISIYNPKSPYTIYCYECYVSDRWDPAEYALHYDTSLSFFSQLNNLLINVPKSSISKTTGIGQNINSDYINFAGPCKNCYFVFNTGNCEDSLYSRGLRFCVETCDSYYGVKMDLCYEGVNVQESSGVTHSRSVVGCVDSHFLLNCSGCTSCFGCVNLRNKSYCWHNEQLTKEEYSQRIKEFLGSYSQVSLHKEKFREHCLKYPMRASNNIKAVDSSGDYLFETKDVRDSLEVTNAENCRYLFSSKNIKDSYGTTGYGYQGEMFLECVSVGTSSNIIGSSKIDRCTNLEYCLECIDCKNLIGCDSLKNKEYCILNKQYSKEEYFKLRDLIIKELNDKNINGLVMPPEVAPFAYNETVAQDNFPMTKEEAIRAGYRWEDDLQMTKGKETIQPEEIPDNIKDIQDTITNEILRCISCERNYKITEQELLFYRKMNLPVPRTCFYCRHRARVALRGPYKFWDRKCAHCDKDIKTNYSPERPEIVYCEDCYRGEVI